MSDSRAFPVKTEAQHPREPAQSPPSSQDSTSDVEQSGRPTQAELETMDLSQLYVYSCNVQAAANVDVLAWRANTSGNGLDWSALGLPDGVVWREKGGAADVAFRNAYATTVERVLAVQPLVDPQEARDLFRSARAYERPEEVGATVAAEREANTELLSTITATGVRFSRKAETANLLSANMGDLMRVTADYAARKDLAAGSAMVGAAALMGQSGPSLVGAAAASGAPPAPAAAPAAAPPAPAGGKAPVRQQSIIANDDSSDDDGYAPPPAGASSSAPPVAPPPPAPPPPPPPPPPAPPPPPPPPVAPPLVAPPPPAAPAWLPAATTFDLHAAAAGVQAAAAPAARPALHPLRAPLRTRDPPMGGFQTRGRHNVREFKKPRTAEKTG